MKRVAPALAALVAATVALSQQTTPTTPAEPRTSATRHEQAARPASSIARMSQADKRDLMYKCVTKTHATNPNVPEKHIRGYCDEGIKNLTSRR
jgi:uncharacterized membrane protein